MKGIPKSMKRVGILLFRDAFLEALQGERLMCVVHAAHSVEILLKARIAEEHPLLIFSKLPKSDSAKGDALALIDLFEKGRTFSYEELPDQLWAATGVKIDQLKEYRDFGRLRNQIVHLSMVDSQRLDVLTIHYCLHIIDPLIEQFWGRSVISLVLDDPRHNDFVDSGLFEDSIRKFVTIDQRLRNLLGKRSQSGWERMTSHAEEVKTFSMSMPQEIDEAKAQYYFEFESEDLEQTEQYQELIDSFSRWKKFLDSF
jgi:hypothetical protein